MRHVIRWTVEKITQRLTLIDPLVYRRRSPLAPLRYAELPDPATPPPLHADATAWPIIPPNSYWGKPATDFMLRGEFTVPAAWDTSQPIALFLPLGDAHNFSHPETLAYIDGVPFAACDRHHQEILLRPAWCDGEPHALALHGWTGLGDNWNTDPVTRLIMRECAVVQIDAPTRAFVVAARMALETAQALEVNDPAKGALLNGLNDAFNVLDLREPFGDGFYASVEAAQTALQTGIDRAGPPMPVTLTATGHAHIDVAWLWTLDQTRRKAGRTFHTVLRMMEQFPDYHFTQSQPQLYDYVHQDYPDLFAAIKERVAEGRWEPIGGMWVEADCNLSGAESLARQFLLGRTYFRENFGPEAESPVLWLPDVFGYAWALPQLIKQAGLDYFFTIKIGWNQYNRLPYDSFWWQGLDGSRVLTHFSTTTENDTVRAATYNAAAQPGDMLRTWKHFQQKEIQDDVFMAFGYGDGGGGPTREMLENLDAATHFPALPQARQRPAGDFFRDLEREVGESLPVWNGELYLEYHRGTYTTQSRNKRANRRSEFMLHDAEFLASLAAHVDAAYAYPAESLNAAWQLVCLNQFHDIIPGSSINQVYVDSQRQYADVKQMVTAVRDHALATLGAQLGGDVLIVNPTGFTRTDFAFLPGESGGFARNGVALAVQSVEGGVLVDAGELPPYSVTGLTRLPGAIKPDPVPDAARSLENDCLRVEFSADGDISQIFDKKNGRDVLPAHGVANQFQAFEDRPLAYDAWDIDAFYDDKRYFADPATRMTLVENGPLRWTVLVERRILSSVYTQRISLRRGSSRLDFETEIDWRERHILLKVAFPVEVLAPQATYEIQWGNVQRPTHRNTSWDWARFETCAQKWVDLSEGGYGVSLLNDCKYGHDIQENVMRLSLLRAPTIPDPEADQGEHRFTYSLLPHSDAWGVETMREAYALNDPLLVWAGSGHAGDGASLPPFVATDSANIVIETVKRAEDGRGIIVRFYESQRRRGLVTLTAAFPLAGVYHTNLLEETQSDLMPEGNQVTLMVKPFEIVTLRLVG